jgi:ribonuclease PH
MPAMRARDELRTVRVQRHFPAAAPGSVLWQQGETVIYATASVEQGAPPWQGEDKPGGWVTANYVMLPGSTPGRKRWPRAGHTDSRGTEIERLIGRSLRAGVDLSKLGPHTITVDCHVMRADGGTRTAAICAGFVALAEAVQALPDDLGPDASPANLDAYDPDGAILGNIAAVSVGIIDGKPTLDLDYKLDVAAGVDFNVVRNAEGRYIEIQGTAEHQAGYTDDELAAMLTLAAKGCNQLMKHQSAALADEGDDGAATS